MSNFRMRTRFASLKTWRKLVRTRLWCPRRSYSQRLLARPVKLNLLLMLLLLTHSGAKQETVARKATAVQANHVVWRHVGSTDRSSSSSDSLYSFGSTHAQFCSSFHIFYSNITVWGPRVMEFLSNEKSHVQSVVEHHVAASKLHTFQNDVIALNRDFYGTAAYPTHRSTSGTSAGVAILPYRGLSVSKPADYALQLSLGLQESQFARWYPLAVRLKHVTVTYIIVYLYHTEG